MTRSRILIADDELIERTAMETLVPWQDVDAHLIASAANGYDAFRLIESEKPDIVITDIKMPKMDGLELIKKTKELYPNIVFVILSGFGEYEYTSQAMELGIRHYILKPVDIEKVINVTKKAIEDSERIKAETRERKERENTIEKLMPDAMRLFLIKLISGLSAKPELEFYKKNLDIKDEVALLTIKTFGFIEDSDISSIEKKALDMLSDKETPLVTAIADKNIYMLFKSPSYSSLQRMARSLREFSYQNKYGDIAFSISSALIDNIKEAKTRNDELILIQRPEARGKLLSSYDRDVMPAFVENIIDKKSLTVARSDIDIFRYAIRFSILTEIATDDNVKQNIIFKNLLSILNYDSTAKTFSRENVFKTLSDSLLETKESRESKLFYGLFINLDNPCLSVKWISNNIAYMNEDYFSRFFIKLTGKKFTEFVNEERIGLSEAILSIDNDIPMTKLAKKAGYPEDGRYFSHLFKEITGETIAARRNCKK